MLLSGRLIPTVFGKVQGFLEFGPPPTVVCHTGGAGFSFLSVPVMIDVLNIVALIEEIEDSLQ